MLPPVPPRPALHEEAYLTLRRRIIFCQLRPGDNIGEAAVSGVLGISRTPLREALKLLAAEGLVELRAHRGAFVMPIREAEIPAIFEVCAGLERLGAECAAQRMTGDDLAQLRALQAEMEAHYAAAAREAYFEVNQRIHTAIVAAARNEVLTTAHQRIFARAERVRFFALEADDRWGASVPEHQDILAALEARDGAQAGALMAAHVIRTGERVLCMLQSNPIAQTTENL
jgi:DNA-binding GntR family transcriptional regulator